MIIMKNVVSLSDDAGLEVYTKLSEVQLRRMYEPDGGLFIAESPKVVLRALDAGCEPVSVLVEDRHVAGEAAGVLDRCRERGGRIPVYVGRYDQLTRLTGYALTRGVLSAMRRPPLRSARELIGKNGSVGRIAVLENVTNPANVGAIFRNAAALGMDAVLLTYGCSDPLYRRTLRVSMGTALQIPWAWAGKSLDEWKGCGMRLLRGAGFRTIAMALREDAVGMADLRVEEGERAAVILGAEGDGLLPETIRQADDVVMIPMRRGVDSLNVAAASAIAFYSLGRKMIQNQQKGRKNVRYRCGI